MKVLVEEKSKVKHIVTVEEKEYSYVSHSQVQAFLDGLSFSNKLDITYKAKK